VTEVILAVNNVPPALIDSLKGLEEQVKKICIKPDIV